MSSTISYYQQNEVNEMILTRFLTICGWKESCRRNPRPEVGGQLEFSKMLDRLAAPRGVFAVSSSRQLFLITSSVVLDSGILFEDASRDWHVTGPRCAGDSKDSDWVAKKPSVLQRRIWETEAKRFEQGYSRCPEALYLYTAFCPTIFRIWPMKYDRTWIDYV